MFDFLPARVVLAVLCFFGFISQYIVRFSFSVISVAMITPYELRFRNQSCGDSSNETCVTEVEDLLTEKETLDWDERTRAFVLGVFNYGYCLTQILGGRLSEIYGAKFILGGAITIPAFLNLFIPTAARTSYWCVAVIRFIQGFVQGVIWPSMHAIIAVWIPPNERSRYTGAVFFASTLGMTFILPFSGILCDVFSWEKACYIIAIFPLVWGLFWLTLMYNTPREHPRILSKEKLLIETTVAEGGTSRSSWQSAPWKSIVTSLPFLAIVALEIGNDYGFTLYTSQMPNYVSNILKFSPTKTGLIAGVPFMFRYGGSCICSIIADFLISRNILSIRNTRKLFSVTSMFIPAIILTCIILFALSNVAAFIILYCSIMFCNGSISAASVVNPVDIAPNYSGTLFGINNTVASISGAILMLIIGEILNEEPTLEQWKIVFWIGVPIMLCANIIFLLFAKGEPQPWNFSDEGKKRTQKTEGEGNEEAQELMTPTV